MLLRPSQALVSICVLFTVAVTFSGAQPHRAWKRDQHHNRMCWDFDAPSKTLNMFTDLYEIGVWDTQGDTSLGSMQFINNDVMQSVVVDETTAYLELDGKVGQRINFKSGQILETINWQSTLSWIDFYGNALMRRTEGEDVTDTVDVYDLHTMQSKIRFLWNSFFLIGHAYDAQRNVLYVSNQGALVRVDQTGAIDTVASNEQLGVNILSVDPLDDGKLLLFVRKSNEPYAQLLYTFDPVTKTVKDSLFLNHYNNIPGMTVGDLRSFMRPNNKGIVRISRDTIVVFNTSPLSIIASIKGPAAENNYTTNQKHRPFVYSGVGCEFVQIDETNGTSTVLIPSRLHFNDVVQLTDGKIVAYESSNRFVQLDKLNGDVSASPWPSVQATGVTSFIATQPAGAIAVADATGIKTIASQSGAVQCALSGKRVTSDGVRNEARDFGAEFLSSNGTNFISSFHWSVDNPGPQDEMGESYYVSPNQCANADISTGVAPHNMNGFSYSNPGPHKLAVNFSGALILAPVTKNSEHEVWQFNCRDSMRCNAPFVTVYKDRERAVLIPGTSRIIMDDPTGLFEQDPLNESQNTVIPMGRRLIPIVAMNVNRNVLAYAGGYLSAIDVERKEQRWSIPLPKQPRQIIVDKDDKWFICDYYPESMELYAFDPPSHVNELDNADNVVVYPNPTAGSFSIRGVEPDATDLSVSVVDQLGRTVITSASVDVDCTSLSSGLYFVTVTAGTKTIGTSAVQIVR